MTTTTPIPDAATLTAALAEDVDRAFPALVRALQDNIYSGALRLTRDPHAAQDITQETFLRAYTALGLYPPQRIRDLCLRGWVWTIAANLCRNRARSRSRKPEAALETAPPVADRRPGPEPEAMASIERDRLADLIGDLPWAMASAVVLRHVVDLASEDIAEALDRPVGTVKSDVHRGLQRLRAQLEEESS